MHTRVQEAKLGCTTGCLDKLILTAAMAPTHSPANTFYWRMLQRQMLHVWHSFNPCTTSSRVCGAAIHTVNTSNQQASSASAETPCAESGLKGGPKEIKDYANHCSVPCPAPPRQPICLEPLLCTAATRRSGWCIEARIASLE